ncbi:MAG: Holliday junction branch migration protein RuvA [Nitrospirae bacterium]|nr:Holliday junction branch migration protein RuvA [Nitrospirota bacterium]
MIALLRGAVFSKSPDRVVIDAGGVGYLVNISHSTFEHIPDVGAEALLHTHLHVREDALQLYGFATPDERDYFLTLNGVSGVGPKLALAILSGAKTAELRRAIEFEDVAFLSRLPGLGKKTASKIILELKGKLPETIGNVGPAAPVSSVFDDAMSALLNLGYKRAEAEAALRTVDPDSPFEAAVTGALKRLSRAVH